MCLRLIVIAVSCFLLAVPSSAFTQSGRGNVFEVESRISVNGVVIGQPKLHVVAGSEMAMGVSTPRGYGLRLTVDDDTARQGVTDPVKLSAKLYFVDGSQWVLVGAPQLSLVAGAAVRQTVQTPTVYGPNGYTIDFRVRRTDGYIALSEFSSVEDCPVWQELARDGPLAGVRKKGEAIRAVTTQVVPGDLPSCCTSRNMRCCSDAHGVC
jgi:hypothetical protein